MISVIIKFLQKFSNNKLNKNDHHQVHLVSPSLPEDLIFVFGNCCRWKEDGKREDACIVELSIELPIEAVKLELDNASPLDDTDVNSEEINISKVSDFIKCDY